MTRVSKHGVVVFLLKKDIEAILKIQSGLDPMLRLRLTRYLEDIREENRGSNLQQPVVDPGLPACDMWDSHPGN